MHNVWPDIVRGGQCDKGVGTINGLGVAKVTSYHIYQALIIVTGP